VGLTDELFTARTPCGVRPRGRDTGGAADSANGLIPALTCCHDNGALAGYGLMNQPCQRFSGGPQSTRGTTTLVIASSRRCPSPCSRMGSPVAARHRLSERRPPGGRLEGVGEILGLVRYQLAGELH